MKNNKGLAGIIVIITIVVVLILSAIIGGFCWTYTLNTWLNFSHKSARVVFWQGALIGFCPLVGQLSLPVAILTWIIMLFL